MVTSTQRRVLTCAAAAALAALGGLQTPATAFLVVPPPSASTPAALHLAWRPVFVGWVCVDWLGIALCWGMTEDGYCLGYCYETWIEV